MSRGDRAARPDNPAMDRDAWWAVRPPSRHERRRGWERRWRSSFRRGEMAEGLPHPGRTLLAGDGVVVGSDGGSGAGGAKVDHREHAVEFFGGVSTGNEVFDAHQTTLQSQFDQRTLPAEFAGGDRERGVQLVLAPGGLQIHGIGDRQGGETDFPEGLAGRRRCWGDRKSTRLNSSHANISYAV